MGQSILAHAALQNVAKSVGTAYPLFVPGNSAVFNKKGITVVDTILTTSLYGIILQSNGNYLSSTFELGSDTASTFIQAAPASGWSLSTYELNGTEIGSSGTVAAKACFRVSRTKIERVLYCTASSGDKSINGCMLYVIPA